MRSNGARRSWHRPIRPFGYPGAPGRRIDNFDKQVELLFDLIALAYQADLTRVASYIMVAEGTNKTYNHVGVPESFHPISHHANDSARIAQPCEDPDLAHDRFSEFLKKMAETKDGDGSILDHSIFLYGSNMGNSDKHSNWPIPTVVVGAATAR